MANRFFFQCGLPAPVSNRLASHFDLNIISCPTLERLISARPGTRDIVFLSADFIRPWDVESRTKIRCAFIVFYDSDELKIEPLRKYGHGIYVPFKADGDLMDSAFAEALKMSSKIGTIEESLIGISPWAESVRLRIKRAALIKKRCVHFDGETGTGKSFAARILHSARYRSMKNFAEESCSSLSECLVESFLFGHRKGSFTGACQDRKGLFAQADGGSLFLDELQDLQPFAQAMLLQVLDSGFYRPVGQTSFESSDFSLMTASNVNIKTLVSSGRLRSDLWYRMSPIVIEMEPLRNHKEDIPEIVSAYEEKTGIPVEKSISDYTPLFKRSWEGNVRELLASVSKYIDEFENLDGTPMF